MAAFKLQIVDRVKGIICNVRYENMDREDKPPIIAKSPEGKIVKEKTVYQGNILGPGDTNRMWCDDDGAFFDKKSLKFFCVRKEGEQEISEVSQTKIFDITAYEPLVNYTDRYIIDKYYEVTPSNNDTGRDNDRVKPEEKERTEKANLAQMKKLWDILMSANQVARGELNVSTRGFLASDGYLRAISIEGKWALEIGIFKHAKVFQHLNEPNCTEIAETINKNTIKMV